MKEKLNAIISEKDSQINELIKKQTNLENKLFKQSFSDNDKKQGVDKLEKVNT